MLQTFQTHNNKYNDNDIIMSAMNDGSVSQPGQNEEAQYIT